MSEKNAVHERINTIHVASPETHEFLMDIIQDAQSLGSIVHIVTIVPPFLALKESEHGVLKTLAGMRVPEDRTQPLGSPQCSPNHNPQKESPEKSPQCSPNHNPQKESPEKSPQCSPNHNPQKES